MPQQPVIDLALEPKDQQPATLPATTGGDPMINMIERVLLDPSIDIAKLERLEQMYERAQTRQAEQAFNAAMAAAQAEMRAVAPDSHNKQTHSDYASYAALDRMARPIYTKHGLALSFNSQESKIAEHVLVLCYVTGHGFTRTYQADMPADGKGAKGGDVMTKTHATGSAFSYAQRYLLRLIFNLAVGEDDDGNAAGDTSEKPDLPEGFTQWIEDMREESLQGTKALTAKWQASSNIFKNFILVKDWESMKAAAKEADKAASHA